jgi:hypothetical protein
MDVSLGSVWSVNTSVVSSPATCFDLRIEACRQQPVIETNLDQRNPGAMKVVKCARANSSPIVDGHGLDSFYRYESIFTDSLPEHRLARLSSGSFGW